MRRDVKDIVAKLHPLERRVLLTLTKVSSLHEIVGISGLQEVEVMRALQWLQNKGVLQIKQEIQELVELDVHGKEYINKGLPERQFLKVLHSNNGVLLQQIQENSGLDKQEMTVCLGVLKRKNTISMKKEENNLIVTLTEQGKEILQHKMPEEVFLTSLKFPRETRTLTPEERTITKDLQQRSKIVKITIVKLRTVELTETGKIIVLQDLDKEYVEHITTDMLKNSSWKEKKFRHYDVGINVPVISGGKRHIVNQAISYIKKIWLDMGFVEMNGNMVQTSYWDLDALFVPQDHPARQMQDTFYIKEGEKRDIALGKIPKDHANVKAVHENGWKTGSIGWQTPWHTHESQKILLRTHTTVLSAHKLADLGKDKTIKLPMKFFNVGRVFRNEALDWKHLFEFHQVDGIVIDPNANVKNLKAYLRLFFGKMGYSKIRMRPAYFPYTEPSLEIEVWHPKKYEWVELGGAGIFRPEVVIPLLGYDVPVLAWGLGLERIVSEYWKLTDIRDLYRNDIKQLQEMKLWTK